MSVVARIQRKWNTGIKRRFRPGQRINRDIHLDIYRGWIMMSDQTLTTDKPFKLVSAN